MTLRNRNKIFLILFIVSTVVALIVAAGTIYLSSVGQMHHLTNSVRLDGSNLHYSYKASVLSILLFCAYVPTVAGFIYFGFEKTNSDEMFFFFFFLISCLFESVRLIYPEQNLFLQAMKNLKIVYPGTGLPYTSNILIFITKILIYTRTMAYLSILCFPLFPLLKKHLTVEELLLFCVAISILVSALSKVRINDYRPYFMHSLSSHAGFGWAIAFIFASTFLLVGNYFNPDVKKRFAESFSYLTMMIGCTVLSHAETMFSMIFGGALFFIGTAIYLRKIHSRLNS